MERGGWERKLLAFRFPLSSGRMCVCVYVCACYVRETYWIASFDCTSAMSFGNHFGKQHGWMRNTKVVPRFGSTWNLC